MPKKQTARKRGPGGGRKPTGRKTRVQLPGISAEHHAKLKLLAGERTLTATLEALIDAAPVGEPAPAPDAGAHG